ncbi:MAG: DsbA family protein [Gammaproteobacteria bacterium]|nr:DsbA family protein [Gammaproteobacteria bacterium]MCH9744200.1 DsbA family protein [Gammaproteobacteria bacterium]
MRLSKAVNIPSHGQPFIGNAKAKNNIVVFEDLKCVNCKYYNTHVFPKIKKAYIDSGKIKYTVITLAFVPGSPPIANAAFCVREQNPKAFFPYVEYIYHHQGDEEENWGTIPKLLKFAGKVPGININKLSLCLIQSPYNDQINKNMKIAQQVMGDTVMTPRVYINGVLVEPLSFDLFNQVYNEVSK